MQPPAHTDPSPRSKTYESSSFRENKIPSFRLIDTELRQVKTLIDKQLAEATEPVGRLLGNFNICSSEMIRPGLVLLSYRAVCKNQHDKQYDVVHVAAIVELIRNGTLLHDDVIDVGRKRRGWPTVSSPRDNESTVLLGDFLLSKAFRICSELDPEISNIIARTANRICEGRLRQITERQNWQLSEPDYIDIITEKSAALFSSCCLLGGLLGGASETQIQSLAYFGLNTGIAFQITDDLRDMVGDGSEMGNTPGSNVDYNKLNLAVLHLLRTVDKRERNNLINSYLANPISNSIVRNNGKQKGGISNEVNRRVYFEGDERYEKKGLSEILRRMGSLEYAHNRAQEFVIKALDALADLKKSQAKETLIETAKLVGRRQVQ